MERGEPGTLAYHLFLCCSPEAYCNLPPGNSADPGSPDFQGTLDAWLEDEYAYLPFRRSEVEDAAVRTIVLEP